MVHSLICDTTGIIVEKNGHNSLEFRRAVKKALPNKEYHCLSAVADELYPTKRAALSNRRERVRP